MFMGGGRASGRLTLDGDSNPRVVLAKQAVQKRCGAALSPVAPQPAPVPLAVGPHRCYISSARLRRASGANISPGPYRSFRELSLAGSVDPVIWCPPTFVGNSGIACFNGVCGFALGFPAFCFPSLRCGGVKCRCHPRDGVPRARRGLVVEHLRLWNTGSPRSRWAVAAKQGGSMSATPSKAELRATALAKRQAV